jgi:hypothetical protein
MRTSICRITGTGWRLDVGWFDGYNQERPHQALGYATPAAAYFDPGAHGAQPATWEAMQPQGSRGGRRT